MVAISWSEITIFISLHLIAPVYTNSKEEQTSLVTSASNVPFLLYSYLILLLVLESPYKV